MEITSELEKKVAQRIFDIGFVKKAGFQIEDCAYITRQFSDLIEGHDDMYTALKLMDEYLSKPYPINMALKPNAVMHLELAIAKAEGK